MFTASDHERVVRGELRVTWRLWKYPHVKAGRMYATGFGGSHFIEDVRAVPVAQITDADAREAGLPGVQALVDRARAHTGAEVTDATVLYRVAFHYVDQEPPKPRLEPDEIRRRLARFDAASPFGPWTAATLRLIEANPGVVSTALAAELGLPRLLFKASVRKLKALGLTVSLSVGYELSELGLTYLDSLTGEGDE